MGERRSRRFYLREHRQAAGLDQRALAALIGTTQSRISELESGSERYNESILCAIADALGRHPAELLTGPPDSYPFPLDVWRAIPDAVKPQAEAILRTLAETEPPKTVVVVESAPKRRRGRPPKKLD